MKRAKKRTAIESEELIKKLRTKLYEQEGVLREMRVALYRVNKYLDEVAVQLESMWLHHQDGSDLLVSKEELFDVIQNKVLGQLLREKRAIINKPLLKLKEFIGW